MIRVIIGRYSNVHVLELVWGWVFLLFYFIIFKAILSFKNCPPVLLPAETVFCVRAKSANFIMNYVDVRLIDTRLWGWAGTWVGAHYLSFWSLGFIFPRDSVSPPTSSTVVPFSCFQSFLASGSFLMSQFFASGGQSIGVSASVSVLPMNIQDWFPLGLTGWISLQSSGLSRVFSNTIVQKHWCFSSQLSLSWWSKSQIHTWLLEFFLCRFVNPLSYFASEMGKEINRFLFNLCHYNSIWYLLFI